MAEQLSCCQTFNLSDLHSQYPPDKHQSSTMSSSRHSLYTAELGSSAEERCPTSHDLVEPAPSSDKTARHRRRTSDQEALQEKKDLIQSAPPDKKENILYSIYAPYHYLVESPSQASPVEFVNGAHDVLKRLNQAHGSCLYQSASSFIGGQFLIPVLGARSSCRSRPFFFFCRT